MSKTRWLFVLIVMLTAAGSVFAANVYVDANQTGGANDGSTWANAFQGSNGLVLGIAAGSGNTIYVAEGKYLPTNTGDPTVSFVPGASTTILGGYSTRGLRLAQKYDVVRDPATYFSTLSGDLNGDDGAFADMFFENPSTLWQATLGATGSTRADRADNSDNVMKISEANVVIDGLIIERGHGGNSSGSVGAGVFVTAGATINKCTFRYNYCGRGSAVSFNGGTSQMTDCWITMNDNDYGGNVNVAGGCTVTLRNCLFTKNAGDGGPGSEQGDSAGVYCYDPGTHCYLYDCVFEYNATTQQTNGGRQGVVTCRSVGGAADGTYLEAYNCVMRNNIVCAGLGGPPGGGGTVTIHGSENTHAVVTLKNCLIADNAKRNYYTGTYTGGGGQEGATSHGGTGVFIAMLGDATIENCTVVNNTGNVALHAAMPSCGVAVIIRDGFPAALPTINMKNSIVWGNQGADVQVQAGVPQANVNISYSCIQNDDPNCVVLTHTMGAGVITTDPQFVATNDGRYNVQTTSPTIDTGDPASDWSKEPKCNGEKVNMGWTGASGNATPKVSVANVLDGDVNCDDIVNLADFSKLASEWLQ